MIEADSSTLIGRAKVLIVDDEYHTRKTIRALLLAMGCTRIHETGDGVGGLDAIRTFSPDVVLLDWDMPGMDGAEFVKRLRTECVHPHCKVVIIMLTGHGERSHVLEAVRSGVHEFLLKPPSRAALKARLLAVLARGDRQQQSEPSKLAS